MEGHRPVLLHHWLYVSSSKLAQTLMDTCYDRITDAMNHNETSCNIQMEVRHDDVGSIRRWAKEVHGISSNVIRFNIPDDEHMMPHYKIKFFWY